MNSIHDLLMGKYSEDKESERYEDIPAGVYSLMRVGKSSYWGWGVGSSIMVWRWSKYIRHECRDRCDLYVKGNIPCFANKQRIPVDKLEFYMVKKKIEKVKKRWYIAIGNVLRLTTCFRVPKGDSDIRLVYDLTYFGLNESLWSPKLWIPSVENVLDTATHFS